MPLKIKNKKLSINKYCGVYNLTNLLCIEKKESVVLGINYVSSAELSLSLSLFGMTAGVTTGEGIFDATGFTGTELKLALINTILTMYESATNDIMFPDNWADGVVGLGHELFKGNFKLKEKSEPHINVNIDVGEHEETVMDVINAECAVSTGNGLVVLSKATKQYQQVKGTDTSSRYVFIASHGGMKMAMRVLSAGGIDSVSVSIRVERVDGGAVSSDDLTTLGLNTTNKGHASRHFQCQSKEIVTRFLIFFKACLPKWDLPDMNIEKIKGLSA